MNECDGHSPNWETSTKVKLEGFLKRHPAHAGQPGLILLLTEKLIHQGDGKHRMNEP